MPTLTLRFSDSVYQQLCTCAEREGVLVDQLINSAVAERMSALLTEEYLAARARRGSRKKFETALKQVLDVEPDHNDRLDG